MMKTLKLDHLTQLKIDAEGYDPAVLLGAKDTLSNKRVEILQFECVMWRALCVVLDSR